MVGLCAQFGRIRVAEASQVLIHEALHNAGLSEQPHDPDGLTPDEIDEMVARAETPGEQEPEVVVAGLGGLPGGVECGGGEKR